MQKDQGQGVELLEKKLPPAAAPGKRQGIGSKPLLSLIGDGGGQAVFTGDLQFKQDLMFRHIMPGHQGSCVGFNFRCFHGRIKRPLAVFLRAQGRLRGIILQDVFDPIGCIRVGPCRMVKDQKIAGERTGRYVVDIAEGCQVGFELFFYHRSAAQTADLKARATLYANV